MSRVGLRTMHFLDASRNILKYQLKLRLADKSSSWYNAISSIALQEFISDEDKVLDITNKSRKPQNNVLRGHNPIKMFWQTSLIYHRDYPRVFSTLIFGLKLSVKPICDALLWIFSTVYVNLMGKNFPSFFFLQSTPYKCHRELLLHFVLFCYVLWLFRVGAGCWKKGSFLFA